jgi:hypothetical protein
MKLLAEGLPMVSAAVARRISIFSGRRQIEKIKL